MPKLDTFEQFKAHADQSRAETIAELGLKPGSREMGLLDAHYFNIVDFQKLMYQGDAKSQALAQEQTVANNNLMTARTQALYAGNAEDRATASAAEKAMAMFSGKVRGPSLIERVTVEPYYSKEEGYKPEGFIALAGGLTLGTMLTNRWGGTEKLGWLKKHLLTAVIGLASGAVFPHVFKWIGNLISGDSTTPAPATPAPTTNAPDAVRRDAAVSDPQQQENNRSGNAHHTANGRGGRARGAQYRNGSNIGMTDISGGLPDIGGTQLPHNGEETPAPSQGDIRYQQRVHLSPNIPYHNYPRNQNIPDTSYIWNGNNPYFSPNVPTTPIPQTPNPVNSGTIIPRSSGLWWR